MGKEELKYKAKWNLNQIVSVLSMEDSLSGNIEHFISEAHDIIDQLDEPNDDKDKEIKVLKSELKNTKQDLVILQKIYSEKKPVVPQFVAEWYEKNIAGGYVTGDKKFSGNDIFRVIQDVIKVQNDETTWEDFAVDEKITNFASENEETFLHLLVNCSYKEGYTVEEKKYRVEVPDKESNASAYLLALARTEDKRITIQRLKHKTFKESERVRLTENEILRNHEYLWGFAEEVR